jgi:hypothetical protein
MIARSVEGLIENTARVIVHGDAGAFKTTFAMTRQLSRQYGFPFPGFTPALATASTSPENRSTAFRRFLTLGHRHSAEICRPSTISGRSKPVGALSRVTSISWSCGRS